MGSEWEETRGLDILVSPDSPDMAIRLFLPNTCVLSSLALSTDAPRIAAREVAIMTKSLPRIPRRLSALGRLAYASRLKAHVSVHGCGLVRK